MRDPDCRTCDEEITQCYSCGPGRYLKNNTCLECSAGCETCSDDSRCEKCMEGYYLNGRHGCTPCMPYCKECKDSMTCTQCYTGYGFDAENGECTPCKKGCTGVKIEYRPYPTQYFSSYLSAQVFAYGGGGGSGGSGGYARKAHAPTGAVALSAVVGSGKAYSASKNESKSVEEEDDDTFYEEEEGEEEMKASAKTKVTPAKADEAKSNATEPKADASKVSSDEVIANKTASADANTTDTD